MARCLLALTLMIAAACHDVTAAAAARAQWDANQPAAYAFTMQRLCFCPPDITRPVVVTVRNGVVESRKYEDTGAEVAGQFTQLFPAVEGLFAIVDDAVTRKADTIDADYDQSRGFPVRVAIDYIKQAADDELTFTVRDFKVK